MNNHCKYCHADYQEDFVRWGGGHVCPDCWATFDYDDGVDCSADHDDEAALGERIERLKRKIREHREHHMGPGSFHAMEPRLREYTWTFSRKTIVLKP